MTPDEIARVLLEVGRRAAINTTAQHPVDVSNAITMAIESAGETLSAIKDLGL